MDVDALKTRKAARPLAAIARMPTGAKVFLILGGALLPLALIAFLASLQTTRLADQEVRARLRISIEESARSLRSELAWEMRELNAALPINPNDIPNCGRLAGVFEPQAANGVRYALLDPTGRLLCGTPIEAVESDAPAQDAYALHLQPGVGAQIEVRGSMGHVARAAFPISFLATSAEPSGMTQEYGILLHGGGETLDLRVPANAGLLGRRETQEIDIGVQDLRLQMSVASAPITSSLVIAALSPLLMWLLAAGIAWFVVDRLLIRPLRRLRATVDAYRPGELIDPVAGSEIPAEEIRELGDTFRELSRTVQAHELELAEGLSRQTRLTREVHHRVKNNLQVIASLINFHARGAVSPEALAAYASIQRRVDALAVVHRHHYAGFEETRGIELRAVIGELASSIRATAPENSGVGIFLDIEPLLVSQDTAVAAAFLATEIVELAMSCDPSAQIRISIRVDSSQPDQAILRIMSAALAGGEAFDQLYDSRYGRVIGGLVRQLRSQLHRDAQTGTFELPITIVGQA